MVIEFAPPASLSADEADAPIRRFAEILHEYDPRYELQYVPEADRVTASPFEVAKPFRIIERTPEKGEAVVRWLSAEEMKRPDQILEWIWEGDFRKHRPSEVYDQIKYRRKAADLMDLAKKRDDAQARQDLTAFLVRGGRERKNRVQTGRGKYFDRSR